VHDDTDRELIFYGTLIEGPDVDLIDLSGLDLTAEEQERVWSEVSPRTLLVEELDCEEIELDEFEGGPGMSDSRYEYRCGPRHAFIARLAAVLLRRSGRGA
jgi:hypothetical protein